MKQLILAFLIIAFILAGCDNDTEILTDCSQNNTLNTNEVFSMEKIDFIEIESVNIDWDEIEFPVDPKEIRIPFNSKSISTREDAFCIGKAIIENCWRNNKFSDYVLLSVVHSISDNIWRFEYSIDQRNKDINDLIDCGGLYVAIDGDKCELIRAWIYE